MVGDVVCRAVAAAGLPEGTFSLLTGADHVVGARLVNHPAIKSVAFTGSRAGGLALMEIAVARSEPIPVHAEMGSTNPVILLPHALAERAERIATEFVGSLTLGAGQFCTKPGLIIATDGPALSRFLQRAGDLVAQADSQPMLTAAIHAAFERGVGKMSGNLNVRPLGRGRANAGALGCCPALFETDAHTFLSATELGEEVFGAASLVVRCRHERELQTVIESLGGQLTATVHADSNDMPLARSLLPVLERKVGRIIFNGWPTGVEVSPAMMHGGPFPATSDSRTTSVGTLAVARFLRHVCYQSLPPELATVIG
jgi:NADP-dependent aldehyde dehydrogenase